MPFNFANPFDDPFSSTYQQPAAAPQAAPLAPLSPDDEEGILSKLGRKALGGLGYIGGSLDKALGGRAIRGVLGGRPEELASLIPFSDAMGITNEDNAVSGKELLGFDKTDDSWGGFLGGTAAEMLLDPGTYASFGAKTALGKLAEKAKLLPKAGAPVTAKAAGILSELNPRKAPRFQGQLAAEMKGLGAGTQQAADLATATGRSVGEVADKPLASLLNLNVPFGERMGLEGISLGTGPTAQRVANVASGLKDAALYSSAGRAISPLFDARLSEFGAPSKLESVQRAVRNESDLLKGKKADIMAQHVAERKAIEQAGVDMNDPAQAAKLNESLRQYVEGYKPTNALPSAVEDVGVSQIQELMNRRELARKAGRLGGELSDEATTYFPRGKTAQSTNDALNDPALRASLAPHNPNDIRRIEELKNVPLGTAGGENPLLPSQAPPIGGLNQLFEDPKTKLVPTVPGSLEKRALYTRRKYLQMSKADEALHARLTEADQLGNLPREILGPAGDMVPNPDYESLVRFNKKVAQSEELVRMSSGDILRQFNEGVNAATSRGLTERQYARQTYKGLSTQGYAPFQNSPLGDIHAYRLADEKANAAANAALGPLKQSISLVGGEGKVPLKEAMSRIGYDNKNAKKLMGVPKSEWSRRFVPEELVRDLSKKSFTAFDVPDVLKPVLSAADTVTNLTKGWQTKFYPSTILRNLFGESFANLVGKTSDNLIADMRDVARSRAGQGIDTLGHNEAFRNVSPGFGPFAAGSPYKITSAMSPDEQLRRLDELSFIHGVDKFGRSAYDDIIGRGAMDTNPGVLQPIGKRGNLVEAAKEAGRESLRGANDIWSMGAGALNPMNWVRNAGSDNPLNPFGMAGVAGRSETTNAMGLLGEKAMSAADEYGRKSAFIGLLKQGYDPAVAAQKALELGMDPARLAPFEKQVLRRLVPFYNWQRHNLPQMLGALASEPGGLVGQSIRSTNNLRQQEGIVPDYAGEGALIPLGARGEDGTQRYLTGLGLPFEDLKNVASSGAHPVQRTAQKLAAQLNPLIRNPIEMATGMQFYSGRDLADLYARSGSPSLDPLLGMTPLQRPLNVLSTLADPRKGILGAATNLLSPARISDIDMNRAAQTQGRRLVEEELRLNPLVRSFENVYVPAAQRAQLSPEDMQLLQYYQLLEQRAKQNQAAAAAR